MAGRYYIVYNCSDCPNMREYNVSNDNGRDKFYYACGAMDEKKLRRFSIIPKWCPLQKAVKK